MKLQIHVEEDHMHDSSLNLDNQLYYYFREQYLIKNDELYIVSQ